jgi:hypothetical protein
MPARQAHEHHEPARAPGQGGDGAGSGAEHQAAFPVPGRWPRRAARRCRRCPAAGPGRCAPTARAAGAGPARCAGSGPAPCAAPPWPARTATGRSSRATRASADQRDSPPSAGPRSAPATTAAPACSRATLRSRGHRHSPAGPGRCARRSARRSAAHARYRPAPPPAATSRHTVDGARPSPPAIPRNDWPAASPREISSRPASDNRGGERSGSRLAGRCNAITAHRMAYRDRLIPRCNRYTGAPSANSPAIRSLSSSEIRSIQPPPPKIQPEQDGCCVDPLRPSPVMRPADCWRRPPAERPDRRHCARIAHGIDHALQPAPRDGHAALRFARLHDVLPGRPKAGSPVCGRRTHRRTPGAPPMHLTAARAIVSRSGLAAPAWQAIFQLVRRCW